MSSRFVRKVRTASGAVAVQLVSKQAGRVVGVEHVGSAHTDAELGLLLQVAAERLHSGQDTLDLGPVQQMPAQMDQVPDWTSGPFPLWWTHGLSSSLNEREFTWDRREGSSLQTTGRTR